MVYYLEKQKYWRRCKISYVKAVFHFYSFQLLKMTAYHCVMLWVETFPEWYGLMPGATGVCHITALWALIAETGCVEALSFHPMKIPLNESKTKYAVLCPFFQNLFFFTPLNVWRCLFPPAHSSSIFIMFVLVSIFYIVHLFISYLGCWFNSLKCFFCCCYSSTSTIFKNFKQWSDDGCVFISAACMFLISKTLMQKSV